MADTVSIHVDARDLLAKLDVGRRNFNRVAKQCMGEAVKACNKDMRSKLPSRWRGLARAKAYVTGSGKVGAAFGLSNRTKNENGKQPKSGKINDWFKAYWLNYGTLQGRDPNHRFRTGVKPRQTQAAKNRKNVSGVKHRNFFESAIVGYESKFMTTLEQAVDRHIGDMFR